MSTYAERYAASPQGVPNTYHARVNPWRGGPYNEGNLYHGPNYDEPMFTMPNQPQPIWQSGPPGTAGLGEYNMYDVNTRGGSFSPKGYGGGIFNLNTALGADSTVLVWGLPNPAFMAVQTKMNAAMLAAGGGTFITVNGILDDSFCAACRTLVMIGNQFQNFLNSLTKPELDMATMATGQCFAAGLLDQSLLPCGFPGSTNPHCGGQPNPPNPQTMCPPGMNWNAQLGVCVPGGIVPPVVPPFVPPVIPPFPQPQTSCPPGAILVGGVCIPSGVIPPFVPPVIPPQPQTSCPPGAILVGGVCIPSGVLPSQPKPQTACPPGQVWDPVAKACMKLVLPPVGTCPPGQRLNANGQCVPETAPTAPEKKSDNTLLYVGLGVVAVGVAAYFLTKKAR